MSARLIIVAGVLIYFALLNWIYIDIVSPAFTYAGFAYEKPTSIYFWLSCVIALLPSLWLRTKIERPSQLVYWMLYMVVVLPTASIPFFALESSPARLFLLELTIICSFCIIGVIYRIPLWKLGAAGTNPVAFWLIFAVFSALLYAVFIMNFGISFTPPSLFDVYGVRSDFKASGQNLGTFENYFASWLAYVINPLLMVHGVLNTNLILLLMGGAGQLYLYSVSGHKSYVLIPIFLALFMLLKRDKTRFFTILFVWSLPLAVLVCLLGDQFRDDYAITSLFTRRALMLPSLLTGMYFEYYSREPLIMMSDGLLQFLFTDPAQSPAVTIGAFYFNDPQVHANGNLWASAYAHFGFAGLFAFSMCFAGIIHLFDSLSQKLDLRFACMLLTISASSLTNSALPTVLMNHGLALAVLLVATFPKPEKYVYKKLTPTKQYRHSCAGCPFGRPELT